MEGRYYSKDAAMLLLATAAVESDCGYYIKQINGPALGVWQMEPNTHDDILSNCDAMSGVLFDKIVKIGRVDDDLIDSPVYACAMARLKYSMDSAALPNHKNPRQIYAYYKRVYNTELGASTWEKFEAAWNKHKLNEVKL